MKRKVMTLLLSAALLGSVLLGCGKTEEKETSAETTSAKDDKETTKEAGSGSEEGGLSVTEIYFEEDDYSEGLEDNGYVKGMKALDYVTLPDLSKIVFNEAENELTEEEVDGYMESIASMMTVKNTTRAIEDGDEVNIDYTGYIDGKLLENGAAQGADVTAGSSDFIDDFLTQIIGHKPGETFDIQVTFPDSYPNNPDIAGKEATFTITVNFIYDEVELTDEFVKNNPDQVEYVMGKVLGSVQEIRDEVVSVIMKNTMDSYILDELMKSMEDVEVPEQLQKLSQNVMRLSIYNSYGMSMSEFLSASGYSEDDVLNNIIEDAKQVLLYQAIAEANGLTVSEEDYETLTGTTENDSFIGTYGKGYLSQMTLSLKVADYIRENITVR